MSRRKQQNPKPVKYDEDKPTTASAEVEQSKAETEPNSASGVEETSDGVEPSSPIASPIANPSLHYSQSDGESVNIKNEPSSPVEIDVTMPTTVPELASPPPLSREVNLEALLGVPDDAPLKVQRNADKDGFTILSAKPISKGAGLDPLRAQKMVPPEDKVLIKNNPQIVSFESISKGRVYFLLESSINCGWLKYIGSPTVNAEANLRIYYVGGQLWVEVIKNLTEGEELLAEFCDPSKDGKLYQQDSEAEKVHPPSPKQPIQPRNAASNQTDTQFPCNLCGISFRNPNTLAAHRKHYCSKLASPSTTGNSTHETGSQSPGGTASREESKDNSDNLQQTAYICKVCKFMSLTKGEMKAHVNDKHKSKMEPNDGSSKTLGSSSDKTYCDDCEIHFKKPESYQAHKQHYCKNRTNTNSPRSDNGASTSHQTQSQSSSPLSPPTKEMYKKVSVFDNQTLSASLATQAAAAMAAASLPFTLSSMLNLPGAMAAATLPIMPHHLKMFQSPALLAQAMQSATTTANKAGGLTSSSPTKEDSTPLDLTVKQELLAAAAATAPTKRKSDSEQTENSPPMKRSASVHSNTTNPGPLSPVSNASMPTLTRTAAIKPTKSERPIYRCESCSIPFYKKDVYEAHRLHYCSHRSNSGSDHEDEPPTQIKKAKPESGLTTPFADERLVITYTCRQCSTSYRTIETFTAHVCALPQASPPLLRCEECNFSTQSNRILSEHAEIHQKVNLVYKCKLCGYHGNTMRGMRQHGRQHLVAGEEFTDDDVDAMEMTVAPPRVSIPVLPSKVSPNVDEELLRLKNEPYKKRRSRKHYQKSEYILAGNPNLPTTTQISPQRKENSVHSQQQTRPESISPNSSSTISCGSPLQLLSSTNIPQENGNDSRVKASGTPPSSLVKLEPTDIIVDSTTTITSQPEVVSPSVALPSPFKPHVCTCNASFASVSTFEAHKKLYCPHFKAQRSNTTITVNH